MTKTSRVPSFGIAAGVLAGVGVSLLSTSALGASLQLSSESVLVVDEASREVLVAKEASRVMPIASLTKLMTALVIQEAALPLDELITITSDDVDLLKWTSSRLPVGAKLSREQLLRLALMSSENRAAHALGRTYPGGLAMFVATMNAKASELGMSETHYVDPTGLSSANRSTAGDLARLVTAAGEYKLIRQFSTASSYSFRLDRTDMRYGTTNGMVHDASWDIALQKTGYIAEAGRCLVLETRIAGREVIAVFLHSPDEQARTGDALRVRDFVARKNGLTDMAALTIRRQQ